MAAGILENDMMAYVGERPWHGLGVELKPEDGIVTGDEIRTAAGLTWKVHLADVFSEGQVVQGFQATIREDTKEPLGVVRSRYHAIQHEEMFQFAEAIREADGATATYETAGSLFNGRKAWVLLKLEDKVVLDDTYNPYLYVLNTFDGSSAFSAGVSNIRVVCNNTLTAAMSTAKRSWSVRHTVDATRRVKEAAQALQLAGNYLTAFGKWANRMVKKEVSIDKVVQSLFPYPPVASVKVVRNTDVIREHISRLAKEKEDLQNYRGTAFGAYQAVADYLSNRVPARKTRTYQANKMNTFMVGDYVLSKAQSIIEEMAA
jgi:phage/plasmid-like protein (TIGR03299 family)